ncbi:hypothetical protein KCP73_23825 [Salmonella enterica subsp. enterica]|nr:hypothetical protein KCP73_23825 [Salmonella enterica subsp. enterica]
MRGRTAIRGRGELIDPDNTGISTNWWKTRSPSLRTQSGVRDARSWYLSRAGAPRRAALIKTELLETQTVDLVVRRLRQFLVM